MDDILKTYLSTLKKDQKPNYNLVMNQIIKSLEKKPRLLIHSCCAVCSTTSLFKLYNHFDITIYFFNPNIHPKSEYVRRSLAQEEFINRFNEDEGADIKFISGDYNVSEFYQKTKEHSSDKEGKGERCKICYGLRLEVAAAMSNKLHFDCWATALTLSPMKDSYIINKIGIDIAKKTRTSFLVSDFKKDNGNVIAKDLCEKYEVYRQCYCGCIFGAKDIDFKKIVKEAKEYNETRIEKIF